MGSAAQTVIALLIIVGSGLLLTRYPDMKEAIFGMVGVVVGYVFKKPDALPALTPPEETNDMTPAVFVIVGALLIYLVLSGKLNRVMDAIK